MKDKVTLKSEKSEESALIRQAELLEKYFPASESTLDRMIEREEFPAPVRCSARIKMWRLEDVLQWRSQLKP